MKNAVTDTLYSQHSLTKGCIYWANSTQYWLSILILLLAIACTPMSLSAASQGDLGSNSNGAVQITLTIPDNLHVQSVEKPLDQLKTSTGSSSKWEQTLCVQGTGIDHYSLSIDQGNLVLSNGAKKEIPYQIIWDNDGTQTIVPADGKGNKLIIKTDENCEDPASIKIKLNDLDDKNHYKGITTLNIGAE